MTNILPLKPRQSQDARDTFDAKRREWRFEELSQEVEMPFDSRLFWLVCFPVSTVTVLLLVYAVWTWVFINP